MKPLTLSPDTMPGAEGFEKLDAMPVTPDAAVDNTTEFPEGSKTEDIAALLKHTAKID